MEIGRGGAYVPARVALQWRIHHSPPPTHNACIFGMETPLRRRSGGHTGTAPTHFVWADCVWVVLFVYWENGAHEPTPSCCTFVSPGLIERSEIYPG